MNDLSSMPHAAAAAVDASFCEREPIHAPGVIQPHGAFLAVDAGTRRISHASANLETILGVPAEVALGRPMSDILGPVVTDWLEPTTYGGATSTRTAYADARGELSRNGGFLHLEAHHLGSRLCIDIEPMRRQGRPKPYLAMAQSLLETLSEATTRVELCQRAVEALKTVTGYDRIMAYRFAPEGHGEVIAEARAEHLEPYLGLFYPAGDVPPQARRLYLRQRVGVIVDRDAPAVPLLTDSAPADGPDLDLGLSILRGISPLHLAYMRNMGCVATLRIGLTVGSTLWGLLICNHMSPRQPDPDLRAVAKIIGQSMSLLIGSLGEAEMFARRLARADLVRRLVDRLADAVPLAEALTAARRDLLGAMKAGGALIRSGGAISTLGSTPPSPLAERILDRLAATAGAEPIAIEDLGARHEDFSGCADVASGALLLPLEAGPQGDAILWFRPELSRTVAWGGNPAEHIRVDPVTGLPGPRTSFAAWREIVRGRSAPWDEADLALARDLRQAIEVETARRVKAQLAEKSQALAITLEHIGQGLMVIGPDRKVQVWNQKALELMDLPAELFVRPLAFDDVLAELWRQHSEAGSRLGEDFERYKASAMNFDVPVCRERIRADGRVLEIRSTPLPGGGAVRTYSDITLRKQNEALVRQKSRMLEITLEHMSQGLLMVGPDGRVEICNGKTLDMLGLPAELMARRPSHAEVAEALWHIHTAGRTPGLDEAAVFRRGVLTIDEPRVVEVPIATGRVVEISTTPLPGGGAIRTYTDITRRKESEAIVRQKSQALEITLDHMSQGLLMVGPDHRIQVWNQKVAIMLALPVDFLATRPRFEDFLRILWRQHDADAVPLAENFDTFRRRVETFARPMSWERRRPNGDVIEISNTPLAGGGFVRTYTDITSRKHSEALVTQKSQALEITLEHMSQGLLMVDGAGQVQVYNKRLLDILDLPLELMARRPKLEDMVRYNTERSEFGRAGEAVPEAIRPLILQAGTAHEARSYERTRPNGTVVEVRIMPLPDGGDVRTYTDITQRKAAEDALRMARDQAQDATRAKSEFLATMSHEIRSPLSGLVGVIELLRETQLRPDQRQMVHLAHGSALALLAVLNDILTFSKIEAKGLTIAPETVDVRDFVAELAEPPRLEASRKDVRLVSHCDAAVPARALVDPLRLRQILANLLSNAVKFTAQGEIKLEVGVEGDGDAARLRFVVHDTGIGMTEAVMARLFEPFMQADASTTRNFGGTGLGLCISKRLAGLMDGTLGVTSTLGRGTSFALTLPLRLPATPEQPPAAEMLAVAVETPAEIAAMAKGRRILVVDDDTAMRWLSRRQLEMLGARVDVAENGETALAMLRETVYDLVLTDCHMPKMDGVALARAIRAAPCPRMRLLPIVGLTADVTPIQRDRALDAGMTEVAIKPLSRVQLAHVLVRCLLGEASQSSASAAAPSPDMAAAPTPGAGTPTEASCFDDTTYRDLFADDERSEAEIWLNEAVSTTERFVEALTLAVSGANPVEPRRHDLAETAHSLAGTALSVGLRRLGETARRFEYAASDAPAPDLFGRLAEIHDELGKAKAAIEAYMRAA